MNNDILISEINYIHNKLFGFPPSSNLENQYSKAHDQYKKFINDETQSKITFYIQKRIDLISLEFFLRIKNKQNLLSQKFLIIFYLTEVLPEYQACYLSQKNDRFAFLKLVFFTFLSCIRFIKGFLIYRNNKYHQ